MTQRTITLRRPDDWHLHLRDGEEMQSVLAHTAQVFGRALIMPNLKPPIKQTSGALNYRRRILQALDSYPEQDRYGHFDPLMTLYLTDDTSVTDIVIAAASRHILAAKLYPANATTNSAAGVTDIGKLDTVFKAMERNDLVLSIHGETLKDNRGEIDIFDRESSFIETLNLITRRHPHIRIVVEHVTTRKMIEFVEAAGPNIAATITAHHLLYNRNSLFAGGIRPHYYCLPICKREDDRQSLLAAAASGNPKFFLGTDSAPHAKNTKETACGCAGCYTAHAALPLYAEALDSVKALSRLEDFTSHFGADFYQLPRNTGTVTLIQEPWIVPATYPFGQETLVPLRAEEEVHWRIAD
ncbi:MAG: dihydroorotase [Candidatus Moranbacteria bacterium]|jgi:dihydroorotase|nr:dihydroorotase [Candidatus Moranbacteria bacterium]